jgi:anaerobic ribonucleoside-triphosphate reductase activating protein
VPETWQSTAEHDVPLDALVAALAPWLETSDGITISGGEPCDQADAIVALLDCLRDRFSGDVLLYSGYTERLLRRRFANLLGRVDAVIAEPFRANLPDERAFIGSSNQRVLLLTDLGRERYGDMSVYRKRIDVALDVEGNAVRLAGVPRRGSLTSLVKALNDEGLACSGTHDAV